MNRDPRLDLALRRDRGRRLVSEWLICFRAAAQFQPSSEDFVDLEDTERLKNRFVEILRSGTSIKKCSLPAHLNETMFEQLKLRSAVGPARVILFSDVDHYIGAVHVPSDVVLSHAREIWELVGEDLSMCSDDLSHGLCLELNYYDQAGRYLADGVYQVTAWGAFSILPDMGSPQP
jgi:hypothetical protein